MKLFLMVKAEPDVAAAWDSCVMAADSEEQAVELSEFEIDDFDHVTKIGTAESFLERGILLSSNDE